VSGLRLELCAPFADGWALGPLMQDHRFCTLSMRTLRLPILLAI